MGWLVAIGVGLALAALPLGLWAGYDASGAVARVRIGFVKITLYPRKKREKRKSKNGKDAKSTESSGETENLTKPPQQPKARTERKGGSVQDFFPLVRVGLDFLGDFRKKIRVRELYLRLILADADPGTLAVNYGRSWAALGNLMPRLERLFVIKKRDVEVECDFTASQTSVIARVDMVISLGRLVALGVRYGIRGLREFWNLHNKRKGGGVT